MKAANEDISSDNPVAVAFNTLTAAQELKEAGLGDREAEAVVAAISRAMNETVATKADIELLKVATQSDIQSLRSENEALRSEMKAGFKAVRSEMEAGFEAHRSATQSDIQDLRSEMRLMEQKMIALEHRFTIKVGAMLVTMTFLLLTFGPIYSSWMSSLTGPQPPEIKVLQEEVATRSPVVSEDPEQYG